ncbi:hypothetical protein Pcinc_019010 [Petrolisthes cinctipes]|uniref:Ionotropic glutamate receptor L-glutamate and glycine-binding domain-containing protein n=1 Tax=Petrolisthes cinctipes TaxID=88211 RepID=A0AAE1KL04_PETCI|nr:hypothetical protein Pcinc_019010 [Petrolisthes cinctipes]
MPPSVAILSSKEKNLPQSETSKSEPSVQSQISNNEYCITKESCYQQLQQLNGNNETWSSGPSHQVRLNAAGKSVNAESLSRLLVTVVQQELNNCSLVLVYDASDLYSVVVKELLMLLPNHPKQVVEVNGVDDLLGVLWVSTGCGGYLLLLDHPQPLLTFANTHHHTWDYHGRYVFVSQRVEQVEALVATRNGKKTEHILGVVKGGQEGEWRVYMNMLYWGEGVRPVTTWRHHRFTSQSQLFPDKLDDLQGAGLRVSTFELAPSIMYYRTDNGTLLFRYGEDVAVVENLARALNFSLFFAEPADGEKWGRRDSEGQWTGMMGELLRGEADMGVANMYLVLRRVMLVDFTAPYSAEISCFMARVEPPLPRWQALAFPFHPWTWLAFLVGLILSGPILFLLVAASSRCGDETTSLAGLGSSWTYTFGLHFREPQAVVPRMDSIRVFVFFLWLYTMILTVVYSTNLTAFLLVQKPPTSIQSIKDLYEARLTVAALGAVHSYALAASSDQYLQGLLDVYSVYDSKQAAFQDVLMGKAVFLQSTGFIDFHATTQYTVRGVPSVRTMKECFSPYNVAMALQQHSPLKKVFDEVILRIQQSGILKQSVSDALRLASTTKEYGGDGGGGGDEAGQGVEEEGAVVALNLDHMQGVFMVAVIGWFSAVVFYAIEICLFKLRKEDEASAQPQSSSGPLESQATGPQQGQAMHCRKPEDYLFLQTRTPNIEQLLIVMELMRKNLWYEGEGKRDEGQEAQGKKEEGQEAQGKREEGQEA